jgi:hypothetical protein
MSKKPTNPVSKIKKHLKDDIKTFKSEAKEDKKLIKSLDTKSYGKCPLKKSKMDKKPNKKRS